MKTVLLAALALLTLGWLGWQAWGAPRQSRGLTGSSEEELRYLVREASRWVHELRARHRPDARPLGAGERAALAGYFPDEVLEDARIKLIAGMENPPFYDDFAPGVRPTLPDFSGMTAMSLHDTVIAVESRVVEGGRGWRALLFHELVHNTQHRVLGDARYYDTYVRGWAETGSYRAIPHEAQAYALTDRFRAGERFSVAEEVRREFGG